LAAALRDIGRDEEAVRIFQKAVADDPTAECCSDFGSLLFTLGRTTEAVTAYRKAIGLKPDYAEAHFNLGQTLEELHDTANAARHFARAAELRPEKRLWRLRAEICGPAVFASGEEIEAYRERVGKALEEWKTGWASRPASLPESKGSAIAEGMGTIPATLPQHDSVRDEHQAPNLDDVAASGVFPGFALSYHGRNQRALKEKFASLYEPCFHDQSPATGSGSRNRPRVGIVVTRRHEKMFLQSMRGIIEHLDGERFELVILCSRSIVDALRAEIRREGLRFAAFRDSLAVAIREIRAAACDLIYYWEVGSDVLNYLLPFARLAPVQCTGWGSTITSGVPAVDYFLSSELIEQPGTESQYTERLWKSRTLFRFQERLRPRPAAVPADFGLPGGRNLYVCFQNPLKLHPDFDRLLAGVLAADSRGLVVLLSDRYGHVACQLRERCARRIPQAGERIVFLPPQSFDNYCRLLCLADVVLDTPHFGAGGRCYDLFSFNLPVVTLPGELIIGRIMQACYRKMGVEDLVVQSPEEYVRKAVQVANDRDYRKHVTERIAQASDVLFNDLEVVGEHERFFEEVLSHVQ
jgi:predicted O-linked N-acetylglucosamine transferase (SPINDLY family)